VQERFARLVCVRPITATAKMIKKGLLFARNVEAQEKPKTRKRISKVRL
jgi:hypothetical protein